MNPGGLNSIPDSFAPAPNQEFPWQVQQTRTQKQRDTAEVIQSDAKPIDQEMNKTVYILLTTSKILILTLVTPPYFLLVKFPRGFIKLSFPLAKTALVTLTKTLKQNYDKAKNAMENALARISTHVVRFMEAVANLSQKLKTSLSQFTEKQIENIKSHLDPFVHAGKWMAHLIAAASSNLSQHLSSAAQKLKSFTNGLKGFSLPKLSMPFREAFQNVLVHANEALHAVWNRMKERADKARASLEKVIEETKNQLSRLKELASKVASKVRKHAEEAIKTVTAVATTIQNTLIDQGQRFVLFVQQPYLALAPYAAALGSYSSQAAARAFQSALQAVQAKINSVRIVLVQSAQAFLMPFKRAGQFLKKQTQKAASFLQKGAQLLAKQAQKQGIKLKKKLQQWLIHVRRILSFFKYLAQKILHGLKLFWIWLKLMASFTGFLLRELFREVRVWLTS